MSGGHERDGRHDVAAGRSAFARYLLAVAMSLTGILVTLALHAPNEALEPLYAPLIGAVALTVWYGGVGPGLVAIALSWSAVAWLLVDPEGELAIEDREAMSRWAVGLAVALVVVGMSQVLRVGRRRATTVAAMAEADIRRLEALNEVATALAASVSSTDVARALTSSGASLVRADGATVGLVDGDDLLLQQPSGVATALPLAANRIPLRRATLLTRAAREGALVHVNGRAELEAEFTDSASIMPTVRSAIAVPLRAAGEVIGSLGYVFERDGATDDDVTALVRTMAGLAEQALERARLYERERGTRQALDRILQIAPSFRGDTSEDVTVAICREARTSFGADYALLWRLRGDRLQLVRGDPPHPFAQPGTELPLEDFPGLQRAVHARSLSFVPDALAETRGSALQLNRELGIRSSLRTPILIGGRAEHVLVLSWQTVVPDPEPSILAVVRRFADQAVLALEELERRRAEADAARRADETRRLQEVTGALSLAATPLDVSQTCLEHAVRTVGANAGFVVLIGPRGGAFELVTSSGYGDEEVEAWRRHGPDAIVPFAKAISSEAPVWALDREAVAAFTDVGDSTDSGWAALPLATVAGVRGALHLGFREPRELTDSEQKWLQTLVSQCAQALERSRLYEEEQLLRARAEQAQSLTAALSNALTRSDVAQAVVDHVGSAVGADGAALAVVEERQLRVLAARGYVDEVLETWRDTKVEERSPGSRALRRRESAFYESRDRVRENFPELDPARLPAGHSAFLFAPLVAGRRANGLLTLSWSEPQRIAEDELRHVEFLVRQAAQALDRATHFESERTIAETLQRSVLPVSLPRVEGIQLAARYLPGTAELDVGGDWFDALHLPDGRLGLVVGDVVGKGVYAAASMAQLRNALRAFSVDRLKPASALARLNRLADEVLETTFATVAYVVVDPATGSCRIASAGHPPPLVAHPDGTVELLEGGRGLPLGAGADSKYRQDVVHLPAGATILLYSDGLVERRGRSIDDGLRELCETAGQAPSAPERLLERVLEQMVGDADRGDDIALLAARLLPVAPNELDLRVGSGQRSLDLVRDALRVWLEGTPLARADAEAVLLAAWEACANAVEHPQNPIDERVRVRATLGEESVRIVVEDSGRWRPPTDRPDRGLGLRLMRSVMSSVDIAAGDDGTRVTIEKAIVGAGGSGSA